MVLPQLYSTVQILLFGDKFFQNSAIFDIFPESGILQVNVKKTNELRASFSTQFEIWRKKTIMWKWISWIF